jgi:TRAP-type C4-dicarboxylate transport system permease small subunit
MNKILHLMRALDRGLARWERRAVVLFLSAMIFFTLSQVLLRAMAAHGGLAWANALLARIAWTDPLARSLMLWLTFLGASLITRRNRHIRIDVASAVLPRKLLPLRESVLALATALICCAMCAASFFMVRMEQQFGASLFLGVPTWTVQVIIPLGFLLLAFRFLLIALDPLQPGGEPPP